ncbi:MAG: alpha/beta fold hydrolase [Cytophagales bacterium]|nr:alpha/beta fold hydrolase [Cytophagales bacterium]
MKSKKITFRSEEGHQLSGRLDFPVLGHPKAYAIFAHCFTCSKNLLAVDHLSRALTQEGIAVLRFDFTGLGQSGGDFADSNFSSNLSDLTCAYEYLEKEYSAPQILIGHSLGGAAVLHLGGQLEKVRAIVTVGAPSNPIHVKHLLAKGEEEIVEKGEAQVNIGGRPFNIKKQFLDDLHANDSHDPIRKLGKALLIMHSPQDTIVGLENATEIYTKAEHPKSFVTLDGADHLLSDEKDARYVGTVAANWATRYIVPDHEEELAPEGEVWARLGDDGYTTEIMAGTHKMLADEPQSVGGKDLGPSPYGYLLAALGTCTTMTLKMYANYKGISLDEVEVRLTHDKVHLEDGEASEQPGGKIDQIKRMIKLEGDLTHEQRKRLIEIADRCPVHKTLEGKPLILTEAFED